MKKIIGLILGILIIVSAVPVFAQEQTEDRARTYRTMSENSETENDSEEQPALGEQIRERTMIFKNETQQIKEQLRERVIEDSNVSLRERFQRAREITQQQILQARERYQTAKQEYQSARERYQTAKENINRAKSTIARCKEDENEKCTQARTQIKAHSREFLLNTADKVLNVLEQLKAKVEANEDLTEEEAAEMLADLDEQIQEIEAAKAVIEDLDEESTKEDIQEAAKTIKQAWAKTRVVVKKSAGRVVNAKVGGILVQIEQVKIKLDRIIEKLRSEGYEIHGIEAIYADFDDELGKARENYEKARELYESDVEPGEVDEMMKQANQYMREAHKYIKYAHNMLRNLVINIKGLKDGQRLLETPVDEDEEEPEDEEEIEVEEEDDDEEETEPNATVVIVGSEE
jgi:hypothetical protein